MKMIRVTNTMTSGPTAGKGGFAAQVDVETFEGYFIAKILLKYMQQIAQATNDFADAQGSGTVNPASVVANLDGSTPPHTGDWIIIYDDNTVDWRPQSTFWSEFSTPG